MKRASFFTLVFSLFKVYCSDITNKDREYKKVVFHTLKEMGGVYIKFLQVLCVSHKFMEGWSNPKEYEVFNQVDQEPIDINKYLKNKESFLWIKETPFASGSFAQLYKGQLKTGEIVAIKILRPSISKNLNKDLFKLRRLVKIIQHFLPSSIIDYKMAFDEFAQNCLLETNYEREISNMEYFHDLYNNHPFVIIPKVYKELSDKEIIVQEYIEGPTLADLISQANYEESIEERNLKLTGSNIWNQIIVAGGEALRTAMTADYVFGDPHPGNIILLPNDKIAFIDFGLVASKPISQEAFYLWTKSYYDILMGKPEYGELLQTTCMCFCPDLTNALKKYFGHNNVITSLSKVLDNEAIKARHNNFQAQELANEGHLFTLFMDFVGSTKSVNVKLDMRNFQLIKAMQAFLCSVTTVDKKHGNSRYRLIMLGSMKYALDYCEANGIERDFITTTKYDIYESYEILIDLLSSIADNDEYLFQNISERMFL